MAGRTTLLIAHRRSTLGLADRIAVLDRGRLADIGTHEELEQRSALYRRLLTDPDELGEVSPGQPRAAVVSHGPRRTAPSRHRYDASAVQDEIDADFDAEHGITPTLWARDRGQPPRSPPAPGATPELLAQVDALPPADDCPRSTRRAPSPPRSRTDCAGCCAASEGRCPSASRWSPSTRSPA